MCIIHCIGQCYYYATWGVSKACNAVDGQNSNVRMTENNKIILQLLLKIRIDEGVTRSKVWGGHWRDRLLYLAMDYGSSFQNYKSFRVALIFILLVGIPQGCAIFENFVLLFPYRPFSFDSELEDSFSGTPAAGLPSWRFYWHAFIWSG